MRIYSRDRAGRFASKGKTSNLVRGKRPKRTRAALKPRAARRKQTFGPVGARTKKRAAAAKSPFAKARRMNSWREAMAKSRNLMRSRRKT